MVEDRAGFVGPARHSDNVLVLAGGFKSIATGELVKFDGRAIDGTPRRSRSMISTASGLPKTIATGEQINPIDIGGTNESAGGDRSL